MSETELELCVLGVIWQRGPCSAYVVRLDFVKSRSAYWSGSAGAIYPAVKRLVAAGKVAAAPRSGHRRDASYLTITSTGMAALRRWIALTGAEATGATYDPVRTRMMFVTALPDDAARDAAIASAVAQTRSHLADLRGHGDDLARGGDVLEALATVGAVYELEARLRWLRLLARTTAA